MTDTPDTPEEETPDPDNPADNPAPGYPVDDLEQARLEMTTEADEGVWGPHRPKHIQKELRQRQALILRMSGATYADIAHSLGWKTTASAKRAVERALNKSRREAADELVKIQYERLNLMLMTIWRDVQGGDVRSISEARMIMRDMNDLYGITPDVLKVQTDVHVTHTDAVLIIEGNPETYAQALAQARGDGDKPLQVKSTRQITASDTQAPTYKQYSAVEEAIQVLDAEPPQPGLLEDPEQDK